MPITALAALLATVPLALAPVAAEPQPRIIADFDTGGPTPAWVVVNDNVMGGRSQGGPRYEGGALVFAGFTNTIGGGFSSLRSVPARWDLSEYDAIKLRIRGDGRTYRVDLRTDAWYDNHEVAYQGPFTAGSSQTGLGETGPSDGDGWTEVIVPFDRFIATSKGDDVTGLVPPLDLSGIRRVGLIINDGIHGEFELHVDRMEAVTLPVPTDIQEQRALQAERLDALLGQLGSASR